MTVGKREGPDQMGRRMRTTSPGRAAALAGLLLLSAGPVAAAAGEPAHVDGERLAARLREIPRIERQLLVLERVARDQTRRVAAIDRERTTILLEIMDPCRDQNRPGHGGGTLSALTHGLGTGVTELTAKLGVLIGTAAKLLGTFISAAHSSLT